MFLTALATTLDVIDQLADQALDAMESGWENSLEYGAHCWAGMEREYEAEQDRLSELSTRLHREERSMLNALPPVDFHAEYPNWDCPHEHSQPCAFCPYDHPEHEPTL